MNPPLQLNTQPSGHLSVRDLATIGIFSILMTVLSVVIAIIVSPVLYLSLFLSSPLIAIVTAPLYMFMMLKVHKRGTAFLYCLVLAIVYLISGTPYLSVWLLIGGIVAELSLAGNQAYFSIPRITLSWVVCTLFRATNGMIDLWFFTKQYLASGVNRAHFNQVAHFYFSVPWVLTLLVIAALAAIIGGYAAGKLMKKHFLQSGILQ